MRAFCANATWSEIGVTDGGVIRSLGMAVRRTAIRERCQPATTATVVYWPGGRPHNLRELKETIRWVGNTTSDGIAIVVQPPPQHLAIDAAELKRLLAEKIRISSEHRLEDGRFVLVGAGRPEILLHVVREPKLGRRVPVATALGSVALWRERLCAAAELGLRLTVLADAGQCMRLLETSPAVGRAVIDCWQHGITVGHDFQLLVRPPDPAERDWDVSPAVDNGKQFLEAALRKVEAAGGEPRVDAARLEAPHAACRTHWYSALVESKIQVDLSMTDGDLAGFSRRAGLRHVAAAVPPFPFATTSRQHPNGALIDRTLLARRADWPRTSRERCGLRRVIASDAVLATTFACVDAISSARRVARAGDCALGRL